MATKTGDSKKARRRRPALTFETSKGFEARASRAASRTDLSRLDMAGVDLSGWDAAGTTDMARAFATAGPGDGPARNEDGTTAGTPTERGRRSRERKEAAGMENENVDVRTKKTEEDDGAACVLAQSGRA